MKVKFRERFEKDLKKISDQKILLQIKIVILDTEKADNISQISNFKKLKGHKTAYRIKLGDYRIGVYKNDQVIEFTRVLHRKDIYKYFPE
jgi:mRNA interferase RelE/StbE